MHTHHCKVCKSVVATCSGACTQEGDHFCTMHHPDPKFHVDWRPYMTHPVVRAVEDTEKLKAAQQPTT